MQPELHDVLVQHCMSGHPTGLDRDTHTHTPNPTPVGHPGGLNPDKPEHGCVCAFCTTGSIFLCVFLKNGALLCSTVTEKNCVATLLTGTGLRKASLGKNDNGCLFIVTEMCGASDMKQRRPLAAAKAASVGTWFPNLCRRADAVLAKFTDEEASKVTHSALLHLLQSEGGKGFGHLGHFWWRDSVFSLLVQFIWVFPHQH